MRGGGGGGGRLQHFSPCRNRDLDTGAQVSGGSVSGRVLVQKTSSSCCCWPPAVPPAGVAGSPEVSGNFSCSSISRMLQIRRAFILHTGKIVHSKFDALCFRQKDELFCFCWSDLKALR